MVAMFVTSAGEIVAAGLLCYVANSGIELGSFLCESRIVAAGLLCYVANSGIELGSFLCESRISITSASSSSHL